MYLIMPIVKPYVLNYLPESGLDNGYSNIFDMEIDATTGTPSDM